MTSALGVISLKIIYMVALVRSCTYSVFHFILLPQLHNHFSLVDGSILVSVFLKSSFCVVPESSYSSNAVISSLVVVWSSNCSIAASSTARQWWLHSKISTLNKGGNRRNWWLFSSHQLHMDYYWVHRKTLSRLRPHRAHIHVVLSCKTPLQ